MNALILSVCIFAIYMILCFSHGFVLGTLCFILFVIFVIAVLYFQAPSGKDNENNP